MGHSLWSTPRPAANANQYDKDKWTHANNVARGLIISGLDDVLVPDIAYLTSAEEMWKQLSDTYYDIKNMVTMCSVCSELFSLCSYLCWQVQTAQVAIHFPWFHHDRA